MPYNKIALYKFTTLNARFAGTASSPPNERFDVINLGSGSRFFLGFSVGLSDMGRVMGFAALTCVRKSGVAKGKKSRDHY
jgi:hypothetical protein